MYTVFLHLEAATIEILIVCVFAFALWKGDRAEKLGGSLNLAAGLIATGVPYLLHGNTQLVTRLAVDAVLAAGFLALALRYASLWLGAALLLQAVQFSLHAFYFVDNLQYGWTYTAINNFDTFGICVCILVGTLVNWRRRFAEVATASPAAMEGAPSRN